MLQIVRPKYILFTFEGHAWERLLIFFCKKNKIKTIGYQFSTIKKNQIGFFTQLKKNYNSDYLATSGSITLKIVKNKISYAEPFKLGSSKYLPFNKIKSKKIDLLVALDNEITTQDKMLNFCFNFAKKK